MSALKTLYMRVLNQDSETDQMLRFVRRLRSEHGSKFKILDVACGYGRTLARLQELGFDALGIEINSDIVLENRKKGLNCLQVEAFKTDKDLYDIVLMSHVVEHFEPVKLLEFVDCYLDRLKAGGHLIIATPLLTKYFYDDFDHVKPYSPAGILMVFGNEAAQVQYRSRNKLVLEDLWFRRSYFRIFFAKGRYLKSGLTHSIQALNLLSAMIYSFSFRLIGKKDAWMGVFRKVE